MIVSDLIYNNDIDVNLQYAIYDCTEDDIDWHETEPVWLSREHSSSEKPLDSILDMHISYITIDIETNTLIIEAKRH